MNLRHVISERHTRVALLTLACFLLTSTGWLSWLYRLTELSTPLSVDVLTMGVGYLMQALGIAAHILFGRNLGFQRQQRLTILSVTAFLVCLIPAALAPSLAPALAFGYVANILCGVIQSFYLYALACCVDTQRRGIVFGGAYAVSTGLSWLLSAVGGGVLARGIPGLAVCALLTALAIALIRWQPAPEPSDPSRSKGQAADSTLLLACAVVTLMSLTKGTGFSFPTVDLLDGVSLELSRLLYGVGLAVAGLASDRNRSVGAVCYAGALIMPFLMLALSGAAAPATFMWALAYLLNGFFSVFRVVLLADLAEQRGKPVQAGLGLLFGRVGDALGTIVSTTLAGAPLVLITIVSVLFACTLVLFFALYQRLYAPAVDHAPSEREIFERFAARHDLSQREREVLRLVLDERTNAEIAGELFVSEATVKYHVRNLLRKTGCKSRLEICSFYVSTSHEPHSRG